MKAALVLVVLLLAGCGYTIDVDMMQRASHVCDSLGGAQTVNVENTGYIVVYCNYPGDKNTNPIFHIYRSKQR